VTVSVPVAAGVAGRIADAVGGLGTAADAVRAHGPWAGAVLVLAGVAALTVSARSPRTVAVVGGAILGALSAVALRGWIAAHVGLSPAVAVTLGGAGGAGAGLAFPAALPFLAGAVPGAILGAGVPLSGRAALGAAAGGALGGVVGLAAGRAIATVVAALLGGALVAVGGVALLGTRAIAAELAGRPFALAAIAVVLAVAGGAYQLASGGSSDRGAEPAAREHPPRDR
jgi:hypothetical protein